jgi:ankyrin repeat protein
MAQLALSVPHFSGLAGEMLEMVIDQGAEIDATDKEHGSALQIASWTADEDTIELLKYGVKINAQGGSLGNALQTACKARRGKIAKLLLNNGADVNAQLAVASEVH